MTAVLDNPFVSKLIRVPFDSSEDKTLLEQDRHHEPDLSRVLKLRQAS